MSVSAANLLIKISAQNGTQVAFSQLESSLSKVKVAAAAVTAAVVAVVAAVKVVTDATLKWGSEVDQLQDQLGGTAEQMSALNFVAQSVGLTTDELSQTFGILNKRIEESIPQIVKGTSVFDRLGIKLLDVHGNVVGFDEAMRRIRTRFQEVGQGAEGTALLLEIFGRSGKTLSDFMALPDARIKTMIQDMKDFGLEMGQNGVEQVEEFKWSMNRLGLQFEGIKFQLGQFFLPILSAVISGISKAAGAVKAFGNALQTPLGILKAVIDRLRQFADQVKTEGFFAALVKLAQDVVSGIGDALGKTEDWLSVNLPKWIDTLAKLIGAATQWVVDHPTEIPEKLFDIAKSAGRIILGFLDFLQRLQQVLGLSVAIIGLTIGEVIINKMVDALNFGITAINNTLGKILGFQLPLIAHVDFRTNIEALEKQIADLLRDRTLIIHPIIRDPENPYFSGNTTPAGAGSDQPVWLPFLTQYRQASEVAAARICEQDGRHQWNWSDHTCFFTGIGGGPNTPMASGGIVTKPTMALIGEAGPEAVVPLSRGGMGVGGTTIIVNASGNVTRSEQELAETISDTIMRNLFSQRNLSF